MKILDAITALEPERKRWLASRWHIAIDIKKRISIDEQVARGLVLVPRWLDERALSEGAREALRLLCAAPRGLAREALPHDVERLVQEGFVYSDPRRPERLVLPSAFRLQLPASPSDSPLCARVLLLDVQEEARRELCVHHLRRLAPLPWPMLLETVLERLEDPPWIKQELSTLSEAERALLLAIDALGGEVTGPEVLELEREPVRIAQGGSLTVPRRSAIYALARRGLVLTRTRGWVVPDEVERVVGSQRRARAGIDRQRLLMNRHLYELSPSRAELGEPPAPLAVALLAGLAALSQLPGEGKGTSKAAVRRVAQQLFVAPERAELLVCLARSDGLARAPISVRAASPRLWGAWLRGGAWDEAAREPDAFRPGHPATAKPAALLRESLLDALLLTPASEFALVADVVAAAASDRRAVSAQRALTAAHKAGQDVIPAAIDVIEVMLERSLPQLGLIDRGQVEQGPVVRIAPSARPALERALELKECETHESSARWLGPDRLACPITCEVSAIVEAGHYGSVWLDGSTVGLSFGPATLGRAAEHDPDLAGLRGALVALTGGVASSMEQAMRDAAEHRPFCTWIEAAVFVGIDDARLRQSLHADPEGSALWAGPPLADGLLVRPGVDLERVHELLARHGARLKVAPNADGS
jgi:hypothetical protein